MESVIYCENYIVYENGCIFGRKGKYLKNRMHRQGYAKVAIYHNGLIKHEFVHRIVAKCFIENQENKPQVNHIDGDKLNNHISNLEWVTQKENMSHSWSAGLRENNRVSSRNTAREMGRKYGPITGSALGKKYGPVNTAKKVINTTTGKVYLSAKQAALDNGYKYGAFRAWLLGANKNKTTFKYL